MDAPKKTNTVLEIQNSRIGHAASNVGMPGPELLALLAGKRPEGGVTREQVLSVLAIALKAMTPEKLGDMLNELTQLRAKVRKLEAEKEKHNG